MRGLIFLLAMAGLLPMALVTPMVGIIAYYWISFMSPQMEIWGIAATPPWAMLTALATLLGCVVAREPKRLPRNAMVPFVILFLILTSISSYVALGPPSVVIPHWSQNAKEFFFLLVLAAVLTARHRVHALVWIMVISLGYYGVTGGLFSIATGGRFIVYGAPDSIIGDNNQLAVALLMILPLMNYLRLQSAHRIVRIALLGAMILTLIAVLCSYSRGAFLALAAITVFFWWNSRNKIVTGVTVAIVLAVGISLMPASWTERMHSITDYKQDASAEGRLTVWREAFGIALARPWAGGGYRSTETPEVLHQFYPQAHPLAVHDIWLEVLSENGFPAFFVWLAMMILGFINIRRIRRLARGDPRLRWAGDLARMGQVTMIAFVTGGTFLSMTYYDLYFVLLVALAATREIAARTAQSAPVEAEAASPGGEVTLSPGIPVAQPGWRSRPGAMPAWRIRRLGQ